MNHNMENCAILPLCRDSVSIEHLAMGWTVRGSKAGGNEIFRSRPERLWGPPSPLYDGYRVSSPGGVKRPGRGIDYPPPHSAPRLKKDLSYTSTPFLGLHDLFQGDYYHYLFI